ncbi:MAG: hypothetical protein ACOYEV_13545 [Candidatus Nanopelagicales bacterium]
MRPGRGGDKLDERGESRAPVKVWSRRVMGTGRTAAQAVIETRQAGGRALDVNLPSSKVDVDGPRIRGHRAGGDRRCRRPAVKSGSAGFPSSFHAEELA